MKQRILTEKEIEEIVRKNRPDCKKTKVGGRAISELDKHCGMFMRKVKVFYSSYDCPDHSKMERRGADHFVCVCRGCGYNFSGSPQ